MVVGGNWKAIQSQGERIVLLGLISRDLLS